MAMSAPDLDATDEASVIAALRSGVLGIGPYAEEFEGLAAKVAGTTHAVAVSSGTAGLHLIVHALGIGSGDEVLVPSWIGAIFMKLGLAAAISRITLLGKGSSLYRAAGGERSGGLDSISSCLTRFGRGVA